MKLHQLYFSPTGGTKKVLDIISSVWDCDKEEIDLSRSDRKSKTYTFNKDDLCIVAVPSYGGRIPAIVCERLSMLEGNACSIILVVVYGNRAYEDTLLELKDIMTAQHFSCIAGIAAVARHSIMHQFATNRPDQSDQEELLSFSKKIKMQLEQNELEEVQVPGNHPYRAFHSLPMTPSTSKKCSACGLCAESCPVQAIDKANPRHTNSKVCISCMRCIEVCPEHARSLNKLLLMGAVKKLEKACTSRKDNELILNEKKENES